MRNVILMRKNLLILISIGGLLLGCSNPQSPSPLKSVYTNNFDTVWRAYDRYYVFFDYKNIDWANSYNTYYPQVEKVDNYNDFIALLKNMLAPLKDVHVWIKTNTGQFIQPYFPSYSANWNSSIWYQYLSANNWHQEGASWGWFNKDSIGYITITAWDNNDITTQRFDDIMDSLRYCKGIIFDIRMNGGGYGPLAGSIGGRFVTGTFRCGYIQYRNGVLHNNFTQILPIDYPQRGAWQFIKPVVLLIGRGCFSTSEIFAAGMTKLSHCITVGDTTGGGLSNSRQFSLSDGTTYAVSDQLLYDTDQKIIEGRGIPPQIVVEWNSTEVAQGKDPVFDYALNLLKRK